MSIRPEVLEMIEKEPRIFPHLLQGFVPFHMKSAESQLSIAKLAARLVKSQDAFLRKYEGKPLPPLRLPPFPPPKVKLSEEDARRLAEQRNRRFTAFATKPRS